jgi:hypothetical protein
MLHLGTEPHAAALSHFELVGIPTLKATLCGGLDTALVGDR